MDRRTFVAAAATISAQALLGAPAAYADESTEDSDAGDDGDCFGTEADEALSVQADSASSLERSPNSATRLQLTDVYGTVDATHPKVLRFSQPWNGYTWWMAFTPLPNGDALYEQPHILASNDLLTWEEPVGFANPLEPRPSAHNRNVYNSDPHLVYREDLDRLECWWRYVNDSADLMVIYRKTTTDGVAWTDKQQMVRWFRSSADCLSPAVIYENGRYRCWYVSHKRLASYMESVDGTTWSDPVTINLTYTNAALRRRGTVPASTVRLSSTMAQCVTCFTRAFRAPAGAGWESPTAAIRYI